MFARAAVVVLVATACGRPPPAATPPVVRNTPPPSELGPPAASCGADAETREPGAVAAEPLDLDSDGDLDLVFRGDDDMFGNVAYLFYRVDGACAVYLGTIRAFVTDRPYCDSAAGTGEVCRLIGRRRMMHDDYQDTRYGHGPSGFVVLGEGEPY